MGLEADCVVRKGDQVSQGKALLETTYLLFRGDFRVKIPLADIKTVKAESGRLLLGCGDGPICLELGASAGKWADKILHPPQLLDKLGVKPDSKVAILGLGDETFRQELAERTSDVTSRPRKGADIVFLTAKKKVDLRRLAAVPPMLQPAGAVWVIYPKGVKDITESDVLHAGHEAGLVDVKVASFSASQSALKFVIPLAERRARAK